ncbi:MAG TPA: myxosortase-dependent M36 family metallopeptidase [Myxococcales bacterium]
MLLPAPLLLLLLTAQGGVPPPAHPHLKDAFLRDRSTKPLVDPFALPAQVRERLLQGRVSSLEPRFGVPTFFWATRDLEPAPRSLGMQAEEAARFHLSRHAELYRATAGSLLESSRARVHDTGDGAVIVNLRRAISGVPVFRDEAKVVMRQDLSLVALSGYLTPETAPLGAFALREEAALATAFQHLAGRPLEPTELGAARESSDGYRRYPLEGQRRAARVRRVYFPRSDGLEPAFYAELELRRPASGFDYFSYVVSARDGAILFRKNLTAKDAFSYRVWADATGAHVPLSGPMGHAPCPYPYPTPTDWAPDFVAPSLITLQNGPISTNDPWLAPGATQTMGNNANAYADVSNPDFYDLGDVVPDVTSPGVFDRTYDVTQAPNVSVEQSKAAVTQLFYDVNFFHDWFYDAGFDEASGNAQAKNYGRGGVEGDALEVQGQDFSGLDNADMSTPSDGESPRMQMYIFRGAASAQVAIDDAPTATFEASAAQFGPARYAQSAQAQLVDDGSGTASDGCESFTLAAGAIAVADRGLCTFVSKALAAQAAGAVALVVVNNVAGGAPELGGSDGQVTIPVVGLSLADGAALKQRMAAGAVHLTLSRVGSVDRDGTIDNTVIAHEWGHYISNRLIGDANGLSNNQGVGMGEGWGDFHSLLMAVREGDGAGSPAWSGVFPVATYVAASSMGPAGYYFGLRRVPYSTDLAKNALTFKHIQEGVALPQGVPTAWGQEGWGNSEVHATGEVWATMLWECYASLLRDGARLSFSQAQDRMRAYLVASYKATPVMPTFVEARDALLSVAAAKDEVDFRLFAEAFARRGLGLRAVAPERDSQDNSGLVESFATGNDVMLVSAKLDDSLLTCDQDGALDNDEHGKLVLTVRNVGTGALAATKVTVTCSDPGLTFPKGAVAGFEPIPPFGSATASVEVALRGESGTVGVEFGIALTDPSLTAPGPAPEKRSFRVNFDTTPSGSAADDVEAPRSLWTAGADPNGNTSSNFRVFADTATSHWWYGPDPASPADTWLVSPPLKVGASGSFGISFKHRYAFEDDVNDPSVHYDAGVLELSENGRTWVDIGTKLTGGYPGQVVSPSTNPLAGRMAFVGKSPDYPEFKTVSADLGAKYEGKTVLVRFRIGSDDAAADKGWEVDDISFTGLSALPFAAVVEDPNLCANRAPVAVAGPDLVVDERSGARLAGSGSDPDGAPVTLAWTQLSGPKVVLSADGAFTAPEVVEDTVLEFALTASDGELTSAPVTQRVTVRNVNRAPVVFAPKVVLAKAGELVKIQATGADPDGDPLSWRWKQTGGAFVVPEGVETDSVQLIAPKVDFDISLTYEVRATDGTLASEPRTVEVRVKGTGSGDSELPAKEASGCGCSAGSSAAPMLGWALAALALVRRRRG